MANKERPITFNAEMVRAILDGRKTQTRRVVKNQREGDAWSVRPVEHVLRAGHTHDWWLPAGTRPYSALPACPFGSVGDRLWVRETWQGPLFDLDDMEAYAEDCSKFENPSYCVYAADGGPRPEYVDQEDNLRCGWQPSIHMPRWASRITLEITGVRVERLQDISQSDAIAEGGPPSHPSIDAVSHGYGFPDFSRSWFGQTWQHIYGEGSWQANPWVWVIEFKRVEGNNDGE